MSQHLFSEIPKIDVPRSMFHRPFNIKTTIDVNYLYPIYLDEVLPGDTFKFKQHLFGRLSTQLVPTMDNIYLDTFYFAVPIRLLDDNWQKFMGERPFGDTTTEYTTPVLNSGSTGVDFMSLSDYLGIPPKVKNLDFVAYWHRAYNLIYNEWFRDENLCEPRPVAGKHYDGTVTTEALSDYVLCKRGKRHDYFTSCLPWPQKGEAVSLPLTGNATILPDGPLSFSNGDRASYLASARANTTTQAWAQHYLTAAGNASTTPLDVGDPVDGTIGTYNGSLQVLGYNGGLTASLADVSATTINALREAFAIQSFLEIDARSGTRYIEIIRGHFGVISPDARMQRPEYLGGNSVPIDINTVASTVDQGSDDPLGRLGAFGTVASETLWSKSFTEHCVILGLANVRADLAYQQGLPRMFSRRTRYDFYWPELANLGEQAVLNKEIFAQGTSDDDQPFGYQERYAEYRYHPNMITGLFRSTAPLSLDHWHLAQKFENLPTLSEDFIEENVPIDRLLAVTDQPCLLLDGWCEVDCARPMPLYSVPGIGRRF